MEELKETQWGVVRYEDASETEGEGLQDSCQTSYAIVWSGNMGHYQTTGSKD